MSTKHTKPPHVTDLTTRAEVAIPAGPATEKMLPGQAWLAKASCQVTSKVVDWEPVSDMTLTVPGLGNWDISTVEAAAIVRGLLEHLSARGDLAVGREISGVDDIEMLAATADMVMRGNIPEYVEAAAQ